MTRRAFALLAVALLLGAAVAQTEEDVPPAEEAEAKPSAKPAPIKPAPTKPAPAPAPAPEEAEAPAPAPAASKDVKGSITGAFGKVTEGANTAINKTKESVEVVKEWFRDPAVVAENRILAARPSPAVAKKYTTQKDAADKAVKNVAGSSATVAGGAVAYTGRGDEGAPRAVALDFSSSSDLSLALADGDLQPAADAMLAAAGANKTDAFSKAVGDMLVVTDPAPPAAALGAAVGVALREAPDAIFTPTSGGNNAKPPASGVAEAFVTGLVAAVKPCAADVTVKTGGSATAPNRAWAEAAAKTCCPYVTPAIRGAQAAVEGGSADAKRVLYSALSRSVALGGEGGFALARCTSPNAKE